jgi:hypothetical protein
VLAELANIPNRGKDEFGITVRVEVFIGPIREH